MLWFLRAPPFLPLVIVSSGIARNSRKPREFSIYREHASPERRSAGLFPAQISPRRPVSQRNPVGGIEQRTAYSHLIFFGVTLNFDKLLGFREHLSRSPEPRRKAKTSRKEIGRGGRLGTSRQLYSRWLLFEF